MGNVWTWREVHCNVTQLFVIVFPTQRARQSQHSLYTPFVLIASPKSRPALISAAQFVSNFLVLVLWNWALSTQMTAKVTTELDLASNWNSNWGKSVKNYICLPGISNWVWRHAVLWFALWLTLFEISLCLCCFFENFACISHLKSLIYS